ncbi:MAG TPA: DUF559 domain-containing protein [Firmicutes bacterium]|nr:DUF559 domain-containing protein [Bacillota bacterium]
MALSLWFAAFVVSATDERYVTVIPQWEVPTESGTFRADFAIIERHKDDVQLLLLVECDGHDYHEKTKQQAAKDKRRDRALKLAGFDVLHFTGSEIWRDPVACGIEVLKYLRAQRDREDQP